MENVNLILNFFVGLISAICSGGLVFYRQNKRLKEIENLSKISDEWQRLYNVQLTQIDYERKRTAEISDKYITIQKELTTKMIENANLLIDNNLRAKNECLNFDCEKRKRRE